MMKYRPLIGINTDYRATGKGKTPHCYLHSGYYEILMSANALPVFIPPLIKESDLSPILDKLDGLMLTGGDDLDPRKMGLSPHPSVTVVPERRELSDRMLCKMVQQRKMPVLGIGLGMQELNVVLRRRPVHPSAGGHAEVDSSPRPARRRASAHGRDAAWISARAHLRAGRDSRQQLPPPRCPEARTELPRRGSGS